ncbi:hypothetical protein [Streptomyces sp. LaPpAH-108]|uniref:hypothetical protein n=1 Tax=Streptomyces sp. LaPpAH-108 TaxID=1155714 RepID=UPI00037D7610|nr:hypothetical protein [Streptomyces sp. LaPpAH-108]
MTAPQPRTTRPGPRVRLLRAAVFTAVCVVLAAAGHTLASCATVPLWTLGAGFAGVLLLMAPLAGRARSLPAIAGLLALGQTALHTLFGLGQHVSSGAMDAMGSMRSMHMSGMGSMGSMGSMGATAPSQDVLVERATRLLCGSTPSTLSPGRAYQLLLDAHLIDPSGHLLGTQAATAPHAHDVTGFSAASLPSLPMLLGHVLAAVAVGWLLRRGDLAVLRLIELSAHGVAEVALVRSLRAAFALVCALCAGLLPATGPDPRARRTDRDEPPVPRTTALQHSVIRRGPPAAAFRLAA